MTFAAAIFLLAAGAILRYATNLRIEGVSVDTIGLILMIAGAAGLVFALFQEISWSRTRRREAEVAAQVQDPRQAPPPPPRY